MFPKRRKIEQETVEVCKTDFLSLNNDCIHKVFEWLELDDLCSVNETCKDLQELASDYFLRKYPEELSTGMKINVIKGRIDLEPNAKYVRSFSKCFDRIVVSEKYADPSRPRSNDKTLPLFIRDNCNENLRSIEFYSVTLSKSFGKCIKNILKNVETIAFWTCEIQDSYHKSILKYCKSIKYLTVGEDFGNKIDELLLETYPTLEHFHCRYYGRLLMTNNLRTFLRQNSNLKRLIWCFHARIREATISDKTVECVQAIVENAKNLVELFLSFDGSYDLMTISDKLKVLCDRKHFQRLHLDFRFTTLGFKVSQMMIQHRDELAKLQSLYGLYLFDFSDYGSVILPTLSTLKNLRILQLDCVVSLRKFASISLGGLTNLEELHIITLENYKFVQQFICQVQKLNKVFIVHCKFTISKLDLPMLNEEREKLPDNKCKLTVYVDIDYKRSTSIINSNKNGMLVNIECIDFKTDPGNVTNPFILRDHLGKKRL